MNDCSHITNEAFVYLKGINCLEMNYASNITDSALRYLKGSIHTLTIIECTKLTNNAMQYLEGTITDLTITFCHKIDSRSFKYLNGTIRRLYIEECGNLSDDDFQNLQGINELYLFYSEGAITDRAFSMGIEVLHIDTCNQRSITDATLSYIGDTVTDLSIYQTVLNDWK
jgi:hypothetical protein